MWKIEDLGRIEYQKALEYQLKLVDLKQNGNDADYLLLLEHEPVFTMGKGANPDNILDKSIPIIVTNRGGDLTYHGPGQLVGYIIMDLRKHNIDIHGFIRKIELLIIKTLSYLDIQAYTIEGLTGVWADGKKIASIGIGVKRGITMHGFALNVNPDLSNFYKINPCGLNPEKISSIEQIKSKNINFDRVRDLLTKSFCLISQKPI